MIGRIRGFVAAVGGQLVLVDVVGIGYEVAVPTPMLHVLASESGEVELHTHFIVRDDSQQLYGFNTRGERDLFRALLRIGGVGPKLALSIISTVEVGELAAAAAQNDVSRLVRIPGVGPRTAQRMLLELRDRLADLDIEVSSRAPAAAGQSSTEAERALVALGYRPAEAARAVRAVAGESLPVEQIVREALQRFAQEERAP